MQIVIEDDAPETVELRFIKPGDYFRRMDVKGNDLWMRARPGNCISRTFAYQLTGENTGELADMSVIDPVIPVSREDALRRMAGEEPETEERVRLIELNGGDWFLSIRDDGREVTEEVYKLDYHDDMGRGHGMAYPLTKQSFKRPICFERDHIVQPLHLVGPIVVRRGRAKT